MALTGQCIAAAIIAAGPELAGPNGPKLAQAIGNAVYKWITVQLNVKLTGVTTGSAGAGTVNGKLLVAPAIPLVSAGLAAFSVSGPTAAFLAKAVSVGLATVISASGQYTGPSVGVGIGTDISKVVFANPATLTPLLLLEMGNALGGTGLSAPSVAGGLSVGISNQILLATGVGVVAGVPTYPPAPAVGTSPLGQVI